MKQEMPLHPFHVNSSWYETYWLTEAPTKPRGRWAQLLIAAFGHFGIAQLRANWTAAAQARMHRLHLDEI